MDSKPPSGSVQLSIEGAGQPSQVQSSTLQAGAPHVVGGHVTASSAAHEGSLHPHMHSGWQPPPPATPLVGVDGGCADGSSHASVQVGAGHEEGLSHDHTQEGVSQSVVQSAGGAAHAGPLGSTGVQSAWHAGGSQITSHAGQASASQLSVGHTAWHRGGSHRVVHSQLVGVGGGPHTI